MKLKDILVEAGPNWRQKYDKEGYPLDPAGKRIEDGDKYDELQYWKASKWWVDDISKGADPARCTFGAMFEDVFFKEFPEIIKDYERGNGLGVGGNLIFDANRSFDESFEDFHFIEDKIESLAHTLADWGEFFITLRETIQSNIPAMEAFRAAWTGPAADKSREKNPEKWKADCIKKLNKIKSIEFPLYAEAFKIGLNPDNLKEWASHGGYGLLEINYRNEWIDVSKVKANKYVSDAVDKMLLAVWVSMKQAEDFVTLIYDSTLPKKIKTTAGNFSDDALPFEDLK